MNTRQACGWPVQRPGTTATWWCNRAFGHDEPHSLLDARGRVVASAVGYGPARDPEGNR